MSGINSHASAGEGRQTGFRRRSWAAIVAGFILLVLAAVCAVSTDVSENRTSQAARQSRLVRDGQMQLFQAIEDAETGQRGYLITRNAVYLQPFISAKRDLPDLETRLGALVRGDGPQERRVAELKSLIDQKFSELSRTVALQRAGDTPRAIAIVRSDLGRNLMARIRAESTAFDHAEGQLEDRRRAVLSQQRMALTWITIIALLLAIALAAFVTREIGIYARELERRFQDLRRESAERSRAEAQLRQAQKMEALGQLTGGVAHDFNNMLAIVVGNLDMLLRRTPERDDRLRTLAENALRAADTAAALTKRLLAFSRLQPLNPVATDVNACVTGMSELLRRTLGEDIAVETILGGGLWLAHVDRPQLESAILNLAVNARDAMVSGGKLTLETSNASLDRSYADEHAEVEAGQYVLLAITDTGSGMTRELMEKAIEPFFTTKPVGSGTGLGLSQVHGFVKQSKGHIKLYSEVGVGTTVKLYLPRSLSAGVGREVVGAPPEGLDPSRFTILIVEDDPGVRSFVTSAAQELGFRVVEADSGAVALERLSQDPDISLLLTDVVMPGMTGRTLVDAVVTQRPNLPVIYMTGYTRNAIVHNGALDPGTRLLTKPFTLAALARELNAALASNRL